MKVQPVAGLRPATRSRRAACGQPRRTARGSRSRSCTAATCHATGRAPAAALRLRLLRGLDRPDVLDGARQPARRAASCSRSRTFVAAVSSAGPGTRTGSSTASATRSPTSSPAREHLVAEGYTSPGSARRTRRERRRPADGRGREPRAATSSARSSPRCRSSTASPRCSTRRSRSRSPSGRSGATRSHDPAIYDYIKAYAPYDNVTDQTYPALLVTAGLNDPRVQYWEPAKWVAPPARHRDRRRRRCS